MKAGGSCESDEVVAQLDDLADTIQELSPHVDDLIFSLYAPVNHQTVCMNVSYCFLITFPWANIKKYSFGANPPVCVWKPRKNTFLQLFSVYINSFFEETKHQSKHLILKLFYSQNQFTRPSTDICTR